MPLDFLEIRQEIDQLANAAPARVEKLKTQQEKAVSLLDQFAHELETLRDKAQRASNSVPHFHVALPTTEALNSAIPLPDSAPEITLLAADGSQINPDRHMGTDYCLVNIGTIQMKPGSGEAPQTTIESKLYYGDEILSMPEEIVALMRDVREREILAEQAKEVTGPVDHPHRRHTGIVEPGHLPSRQEEFKKRYFAALAELYQRGAIAAGYVDRPRTSLLVRLLEIAPEEIQAKRCRERPFPAGIAGYRCSHRQAQSRRALRHLRAAQPPLPGFPRRVGPALLLPECLHERRETGAGKSRITRLGG